MACRLLHPCPDEQVVLLDKGGGVVYEELSSSLVQIAQLKVEAPSAPLLPKSTPPTTQKGSSCARDEGKEEVAAPWEELPEHLLAVIFAGLQQAGEPEESTDIRVRYHRFDELVFMLQ
jgi:hypothetical protein